ncbi:gas vesicle protein K [Longibacter sp.]|uniref:gas vesicle protein K n=1 Tax=Longibacter sp. TaxID=2045415 RepID=UPI003EBE520D
MTCKQDAPGSIASDTEDVPAAGSIEETLDRMQSQIKRVSLGETTPASEDGETGGSDGLARLVLTLVQLLHDVLERQAVRRMENDTLTPDEVERVGRALMRQAEEIERICEAFGIDPDDLDIDLGTVQVDDV